MLKQIADAIANGYKRRREHAEEATVLIEGMERSIQLDRHSCGAQSIFMVLKHFGKARSFDAVKKALGTDADGTSQTAMIRLLRARGLRVSELTDNSVRAIERSIGRGSPIIAWMGRGAENHRVVLYGYSRSHIWILDPSPKNTLGVRITRSQFRRRWGQYAIAVSKRRLNHVPC
jgi:ABC-type bacteriocin/lantibiotic exporter with double-glycine peptidase domain